MPFFSEHRCGLESSASSAKLVLLTRHKTRVRVDDVRIEEESFAARSTGSSRPPLEIARQLLSQCKLSGHRTIFVAGEGTASCLVIIPQMGPSDVESALLLQARRLLGWDMAAPIMAHLDSTFLRDRIGSLVGLADWKAVKPWCRLIESRGGMVDDLTVRSCAYQAIARWQHWPEHYGVVLIMDIGAASTGFYFLDGANIRFVREVPLGGDAFTKALMTELSTATGTVRLSGVEAERMKIKGSSTGGEQTAPLALKKETPVDRGVLTPVDMMVRPMIERILAETQRSIQFFSENTGQKIVAVMLTGGASNVALLRSELQAALSVPVKEIDPLERLQFREERVKAYAEEHKTQLAVAIGLGLAHEPPLGLLPKVDRIAKHLAVFAFAAVAALLVLAFLPLVGSAIYQTIGIQETRANLARARAQDAQMEASRREFQDLQPRVRQVEEQCQFLRSVFVREPLWPGVFNALADAVPENVVLTHCATVPATKGAAGAIAITGQVLSSADGFDQALAALLAALSASPFFSQVTVTMAEAQRTEEMHGAFEIRCELVY